MHVVVLHIYDILCIEQLSKEADLRNDLHLSGFRNVCVLSIRTLQLRVMIFILNRRRKEKKERERERERDRESNM